MAGPRAGLLLLAAWGLSPARAGGGTAVAGTCAKMEVHSWFHSRYEYFHLENWVLAILVLATLLFETAWHSMVHYVQHLKKYGKQSHGSHAPTGGNYACFAPQRSETANFGARVSEKSNGVPEEEETNATNAPVVKPTFGINADDMYAAAMKMKVEFRQNSSKTLYGTLTERCAGELMVLGFLAWTVWTIARSGAFYKMACYITTDAIGLPTTAHGWLETVEDVHIHLFLGMVAFIFILTVMTWFLARTEQQWEEMNNVIMLAAKEGQEKSLQDICPPGVDLDTFKFFFKCRVMFCGRMAVVLSKTEQEEDKADKITNTLVMDVFEEIQRLENPRIVFRSHHVPEHLDTWFPFNEFVHEMLHHLVEELVEIKYWTWLYLAGGLILSAILILLTHSPAVHWVVLVCQLLFAIVMGLGGPCYLIYKEGEQLISAEESKIQKRMVQEGMIEDHEKKLIDHPSVELPSWLPVEHLPMFSMQMFVFYWCYNAIRLVASNYWWHEEYKFAAAALVVLVLTVPMFGHLLARLLANFALVMARGDLDVREVHMAWVYGIADKTLMQMRKRHFLRARVEFRKARTASTNV